MVPSHRRAASRDCVAGTPAEPALFPGDWIFGEFLLATIGSWERQSYGRGEPGQPCDAGGTSDQEGDKPLGAPHVGLVRLAQTAGKSVLLDVDPVGVAGQGWDHTQKRHRVGQAHDDADKR